MNKEEIQDKVVSALSDLFEIDANEITLESRLYEDLDIDSIDAVDLIVELKKSTAIKVRPEDFKEVRTVEDIVDAVERLMNN